MAICFHFLMSQTCCLAELGFWLVVVVALRASEFDNILRL